MGKIMIIGLLFFSAIVFGQCEEIATSFGNNSRVSSYNVNGDVSIVYSNNQLTFKTDSNYNTANGPDVRAYLVNSEGKTNQQIISADINEMPNIPFGLVTFSGEQEITIDAPEGVELKDYDVVFFYCFEFSQFWDFGKIDLTGINECSLSVKNLDKINEVNVFPNPVSNRIYLEGNTDRYTTYKLVDIQGRVVKQSNQVSNVIELEGVSKGVYTLFLSSDTSYEIERIVIK